jgi:hypothetical protein
MISLFLFACSSQTLVQGTVQDIWDKPIEGVQVQMENVEQSTKTKISGNFSFPAVEGTMRFRTTKEGFIPSVGESSYTKGSSPSIQISMYPTVEKNGFWLIDSENYTSITASSVKKKESSDQRILGLYDVGSAKTNKPKPSFVFRTTLRKEQLQQLDLELHRLNFIDKTTFTSLTGPKNVDIDLWVPDFQAKFVIKDLGAEDYFLIEISDPLEAGVYAFHSHNVLNKEVNMDTVNLPKELLMGFPFEIK